MTKIPYPSPQRHLLPVLSLSLSLSSNQPRQPPPPSPTRPPPVRCSPLSPRPDCRPSPLDHALSSPPTRPMLPPPPQPRRRQLRSPPRPSPPASSTRLRLRLLPTNPTPAPPPPLSPPSATPIRSAHVPTLTRSAVATPSARRRQRTARVHLTSASSTVPAPIRSLPSTLTASATLSSSSATDHDPHRHQLYPSLLSSLSHPRNPDQPEPHRPNPAAPPPPSLDPRHQYPPQPPRPTSSSTAMPSTTNPAVVRLHQHPLRRPRASTRPAGPAAAAPRCHPLPPHAVVPKA